MKFQSIFIFYSVVLIDILYGKEGPLDENDNKKRWKDCGSIVPNSHGNLIIGWAGGSSYFATTNLISTRHILTSAYPVMGGKQWRNHFMSAEQFDEKSCEGDTNQHIKVPDDILRQLKFGCTPEELSAPNNNIAVRAFLICNRAIITKMDMMPLPMLVEMQNNVEYIQAFSPLCMPKKDYNLETGKLHDFHEYSHRSQSVVLRDQQTIKEQRESNEIFNTEPFQQFALGGPLISMVDGKDRTLVGISASGGQGWFIDVRWLINDICDLFGICEPQQFPETTPLPEPTPAPTEAPTTVAPTPDPTEAPTAAPPPPPEATPPPPTDAPTTEPPPPETTVPPATEAPTTVPPEPTPDPPPPSTVLTTKEPKPTPRNPTAAPTPSTSTSHKPEPTETTPATDPTEEPGSWTELETDLDAETEKLKEKNKGMNEFDDWDNDFFEDRNFIKTATRIELFIVVLLVFMVLR